jgi:hypothetical protein
MSLIVRPFIANAPSAVTVTNHPSDEIACVRFVPIGVSSRKSVGGAL